MDMAHPGVCRRRSGRRSRFRSRESLQHARCSGPTSCMAVQWSCRRQLHAALCPCHKAAGAHGTQPDGTFCYPLLSRCCSGACNAAGHRSSTQLQAGAAGCSARITQSWKSMLATGSPCGAAARVRALESAVVLTDEVGGIALQALGEGAVVGLVLLDPLAGPHLIAQGVLGCQASCVARWPALAAAQQLLSPAVPKIWSPARERCTRQNRCKPLRHVVGARSGCVPCRMQQPSLLQMSTVAVLL